MPFALIPPGQRVKWAKGKRYVNRYWYVRGTVDGRGVEVSAQTADKAAAQRFARELERKLRDGRIPGPGEEVAFAAAAELYKAWRGLSAGDARVPGDHPDVQRIARLKRALGARPVGQIQHADLVAAATELHPAGSPQTRNREVLRPAAAILHYAADNKWCVWLRVKLFREPRARTRAVSVDTAVAVLAAVPAGRERLLVLWLFRQADRISDALRVAWDGEQCAIDLARRVVRARVGKTDEWREKPLDDEVWQTLANLPEAERTGRLFPWRSRYQVYRWLRPATQALGVRFTPHMARHSLGRWLNESGAGLKTIMEALDHKDPKSSLRYQSADVEVVRAAIDRTPRLLPAPTPAAAPAAGTTPGKHKRKAQNG